MAVGDEGEGLLENLEFLAELFGLGYAEDELKGIAGGAETDRGIGVIHGLGYDGSGLEGEALDFLGGDLGSGVADALEFLAKVIVIEPAVEGGASDASGARAL